MNETMNKILDKLLFDGIVMDIAPDYAEPGYTLDTGKEKILIGDWNSSAIDKELTEKLEEYYELVWSDEYMVCVCIVLMPLGYNLTVICGNHTTTYSMNVNRFALTAYQKKRIG